MSNDTNQNFINPTKRFVYKKRFLKKNHLQTRKIGRQKDFARYKLKRFHGKDDYSNLNGPN